MNWPNLVPVPELYRWLRDEVPGGRFVSQPSIAQAIIALGIAVIALIVLGVLQIQIRRIGRDLQSSLVIQTAIIEGLPKDLETLKKRIQDLESHTDLHGIKALLAQRFMAGRQRAAAASLEGIRRAVNIRSEGEDP